jgi:hypothetical protein
MPNILDQFFFDVNYGFGRDSVFTIIDNEIGPLPPPIEGYFLLLDGSDFLLLDGENLTLL